MPTDSAHIDAFEDNKALRSMLMFFLKGDTNAIQFCMDVMYVCHIWDDLIDKDNELSDKQIHEAFTILMLHIPENPFYQAFGVKLRPLLHNMIIQWKDANTLERGDEHDRHMAYMLRASPLQVINYCAVLVGGADWYDEVGPDMRRMYQEDFDKFMKEMPSCQA